MAKIVLSLFGLLYLVLGVWCIVAPEITSKKVGLYLVEAAGKSEFIVVYGGLEIALGVFFLYCGFDAQLLRAGLIFALISSACLAIARTATLIFIPGIPRSTYTFYVAEVVMTVVAGTAFYMYCCSGD